MNLVAWAERNGVARVTAYRWFRGGLLPVPACRVGRLVARVTEWATDQQIAVDKVVVEVGSALNGHRRTFLALLRDQSVHRIVVGHRGRFCRFGSEFVKAALAAQGRELVVVDAAEVDDDLVREMTEERGAA